MAPTPRVVLRDMARSAVVAAGPLLARRSAEHLLARRGLTVTDTQKITLGIIAVYVVVIALLWNIPYVRNVLWPFKVSACPNPGSFPSLSKLTARAETDAGHRLPRV